MPVNIGTGREHSFEEPLGLLSDCHRRIESFLAVLARVADEGRGGPLDERKRAAVETALRYFRTAAPRHTEDEEQSLFPRMRACGSEEARAALAKLDELEADHRRADELHAEVDALFREWYYEGRLPVQKDTRLRAAIAELLRIYTDHIRLEDEYIFPVAGRSLDSETQKEIGREMAGRRGVLAGSAPSLVPVDKLR